MKFAHLADCHIGSWRDPRLRDITTKAFCQVMDMCIQKRVDFIVISGDLFNTSLPSLDLLKSVVKKLKQVQEQKIPVYGIAGSHDYSPSGKTMLDVLSAAGLFINVAKFEEADDKLKLFFTQDPGTGVKLTGIVGKKGGLEKDYYHYIDREHVEKEEGYKIFLFHTALSELKPDHLKEMEANPISLLPKNFNYYAGGHLHIVKHASLEGYPNVVYPGPLFPNSFSELEKLDCGGFYLIDVKGGTEEIKYVPIVIHPITNIIVDSDYKTPDQITNELLKQTKRPFDNAVVTIRLQGTLREGSLADIDFRQVFDQCYTLGAHFVMKNTAKLQTRKLQEIKIHSETLEDIEQAVINEHVGQFHDFDPQTQKKLAIALLQALSVEKDEGERVVDFEDKIIEDSDKITTKSLQ